MIRAPVLLLAACYAVTSEELRLHDEDLRPDPPAEADADADTDADTDADADPDGDDTLAGATPLTVTDGDPTCLDGAISGADLDHYVLVGTSDGDVVWAWTEAARLLPTTSALDTVLEYLDRSGDPVATGDDLPFALSSDSAVVDRSDGDPLYVVVTGARGTSGDYRLCASRHASTELPGNDTYAIGAAAQGVPWPVHDGVVQIVGHTDEDDPDYHVVRVPADHTMRAALVRDGHGIEVPYLTLWPPGGGTLFGLAVGDDAEYDPAAVLDGYPVDAALQWRSEQAEDLIVGVHTYANGGWYVVLVDTENAVFGDGDDPPPTVAPVPDGLGGFVVTAGGTVGMSVDPADAVRISLAGLDLDDGALMSAWVQGLSVGATWSVRVDVTDTGGAAFTLVADPAFHQDPVASNVRLENYTDEILFTVTPGQPYETPWFLTVRIE